MPYDPDRHHRHSIRLPWYDYRQAGAYFVTLVTRQRECLFGDVIESAMMLSRFGEIAAEEWWRSADMRQEIVLRPDEFIVMPNHVHGIVWIVENDFVGASETVGATGRLDKPVGAQGLAPLHRQPRSLGSFIAGYKAAVTKRINHERGSPGDAVWQRNYYEHILRDMDEWEQARTYMRDNPAQWHADRENPANP